MRAGPVCGAQARNGPVGARARKTGPLSGAPLPISAPGVRAKAHRRGPSGEAFTARAAAPLLRLRPCNAENSTVLSP
jgi:hypothetical protein